MECISDFLLAQKLQEQFDHEAAFDDNQAPNPQISKSMVGATSPLSSLVDEKWELIDPTPDARALFLQFNDQFFWGKLSGCEVKWSPRMTLCAGVCSYEGHGGLCSVKLSVPLLKLRPRKDLVETLLHEMIHAYLFVTNNDRDRDGHGPEFQKHMHRINAAAKTRISIYHDFHDEVDVYRQHWWHCDGPCQKRKPFFGFVKRAMNRAPSARDPWWADHQRTCNGTFQKIKEPEGYGKKQKKDKADKEKPKPAGQDIRTLFAGKGQVLGGSGEKSNITNLSQKKPSTSGNSVKNNNSDKDRHKIGSSNNDLKLGNVIQSEKETTFDDDLDIFDWSVFNDEMEIDGWDDSVYLKSSDDDDLQTSAEQEPNLDNSNQDNQHMNTSTLPVTNSCFPGKGFILGNFSQPHEKPRLDNMTNKHIDYKGKSIQKSNSIFPDKKRLPNGKVSSAAKRPKIMDDKNNELNNILSSKNSAAANKSAISSVIGHKVKQSTYQKVKTATAERTGSVSSGQNSERSGVIDLTEASHASDPIRECPVCKELIEESKMNEHLDLCLQ